MGTLLALLSGGLVAAGVYLMLDRNRLRFVYGFVLLSNAANLLIFAGGRLGSPRPPLVPPGAAAPVEATANPLTQAMILTAIVIGFALVSFLLVLLLRAFEQPSDGDETDEPTTEES